MKETSPELERLGMCTPLRNGTFPVLSGWAPVLYPAIVGGASGGILAVANILPDECVRLFELARAGQHDAALALQRSITQIARFVSSVHGIAGLKAAMEELGYRGGPVRMPLPPLSSSARAEITHALKVFQVRQ
jgi:4-hydroxy-2-oxoglutarate aldolase